MVRFAAAKLALAVVLLGASASGSEIMLLDFWSPTCGPCMQMKPTVHSLVDAGYPIRQVDCSREPELARQYGVTGIPCFVMLVDGRETERLVGATSSERLQQMFVRAKEVVQGKGAPGARTPSPGSSQPPAPAGHSIPWPEESSVAPRGNDGQPGGAVEGTYGPGQGGIAPQGVAGTPTIDDIASQGAPRPTSPTDAKLLSCSVRLRVDDSQGHSFGTGTIIDAREGEALVISCGHLFRESKGEGPITAELFEAGPQGVRVAGQVSAKLLRYDLDRDVALLSIRPNRPISVAKVAPPRTSLERGDRVASVGCSNGKDPTVQASRVTWLDRYQGPPNIEVSGAPVEGRSGGGLFNGEGQLVGICYAADNERNEGLYAGLESIHAELDRLGMKEIYAGTDRANALRGLDPANGPIVRGQEEAINPVMPIPNGAAQQGSLDSTAAGRDTTPSPPIAGLNATEQAALEEIMSRAAEHEVVCIIRPKEPGGQSEVITIDSVSPQFIRALEEARHREPSAPMAR